MAQFNLDDYEPVEERLQRYIKDHPDFRVATKVQSQEEGRITIKAYLYKNVEEQEKNLPHATGLAEETRGEGFVNKTSHVENCETSAIGRALANAGYNGNKNGQRASKQEMQKVQRQTENGTPKDSASVISTNDDSTTKFCSIHGEDMKEYTAKSNGRKYHAHQMPNKEWCYGTERN